MTHTVQKFDAKAYYADLPKKRTAAAVMLKRTSPSGPEILLVRLSYDEGWVLPGGGCDAGEAPAATAIREVYEEVGIWIDHPELRLVKFRNYNSARGDVVEFHYVVDVPYDIAITIDGHEVIEYQWLPIKDAKPLMREGWAETLDDLAQAIATNQVLYSEDIKTAA